ncbi:MAG: mechanosensitive ion channel protein MscS [Chromatiaceae bacterium]|nr:MAG: mechanosensitive ion channel protein MscS [Chromatiaceae bacterium]
MFHRLDALIAAYWPLFLGLLLALPLWRGLTRRIGWQPLLTYLPVASAAADVLLLPLAVLLAGHLLQLANGTFGHPLLAGGLDTATRLIAFLTAAWAIGRLLERYFDQRSEGNLRERLPKLVIGLIYSGLLLGGLILFLWQQGYDFTGIWVSTGVVAAVIGFALQRTLGDLFAGITLGLERPFRIGDWLELPAGIVGQVVDINWRATHLRGWDNATHVIPNGRMAAEAFKNLHGDQHVFSPWYFIQIPAEVDPRFATALLLDAAMRCESVMKFPNPVVRLADGTGPPFRYMVWVHLRNYPAMFRAREELFREIHRGLQEAGIAVSPQVHELHTRRAPVITAEPPTIALALKAMDLAGNMTETELEQIAARSEYCQYNAGALLLAEGAVSDAFYVIAGGLVESAIRLADDTRKAIETLGPGKHFGITAMLTTEPSFLEFTARTDVTLIRIDLDCVRTVVAARPDLAELLAGVVKERLDAAEAARVASRRPARRLSLRDIRLGMERRLRGLRSPPR